MATNERNLVPTFTVGISIQNNTLVVGENGGNVVGAPEEIVAWSSGANGPKFTLEFFQLISEPSVALRRKEPDRHTDVAIQSRWPFSFPPEPASGVIGPTNEFAGILKGPDDPATSFKYYVTVGNLRLDPIIIVDR